MKIAVASLIVLAVLSVNGVAQEYTRWGLPEGAKIRLGKGRITEIEFSPDGNLLAAASTIGIWLYDTETLQEVSLLTVSWGNVASIAFTVRMAGRSPEVVVAESISGMLTAAKNWVHYPDMCMKPTASRSARMAKRFSLRMKAVRCSSGNTLPRRLPRVRRLVSGRRG